MQSKAWATHGTAHPGGKALTDGQLGIVKELNDLHKNHSRDSGKRTEEKKEQKKEKQDTNTTGIKKHQHIKVSATLSTSKSRRA